MDGATVTLTSGVYRGGSLAKEIEQQLGTLYVINDTNNTLYWNGTAVTLTRWYIQRERAGNAGGDTAWRRLCSGL